jgi:PKD repeat protein
MNRMSLSIFIILLLTLGTFSTIGSHQTPGTASATKTRQAGLGRLPQLGIDCGLGAAEATLNGTSFPVAPSENGAFQTRNSCTWIGDIGNYTGLADNTIEPLVSDQDEMFSLLSPNIGGGFTADMVYLQNGTSLMSGFDITVSYNPSILRAVKIDQSGLPWNALSPFTALSTIDNSQGLARLAQVILGSPFGANFTLFRIRFDVIGVGVTALTLVNDQIVSPAVVVHQTLNGAFDSESFFDPTHTLNWNGGFIFSPSPPIPGSPTTFLSSISCPGCTSPLHYQWDFNNDGITDSISNPATITVPTSTLHASRITLKVSDNASPLTHNVTVVERLPFTSVIQAPSTLPVDTAAAWNGIWLGGIANYAGSWRFCPGTGTVGNAICARPTSPIASTLNQNNTVTLGGSAPGYHFSGVYSVSLTLTDSGSGPVPPNTIKAFSLVNVTGGTPAYTVAVTPQSASVGQPAKISTVLSYSNTYPLTFRASTFKYTFYFGDGTSSILTSAPGLASMNHTYTSSGTYNIKVVAQDTLSTSKIQESGFASVNIVQTGFDYSLSMTPNHGSVPSSGGTTSSLVIVNTDSGVPQQVTLMAPSPASGVSVTFNATMGVPPFASSMTVSVSPSTSPGIYTIAIIANTTSGLTRTAFYSLTVGTPMSSLPVIGVWSNQYASSNITDTSLVKGSTFHVEINVTKAPNFGGYELVLYYDPTYITVTSFDISTGTIFPNPFQAPNTYNSLGALRLGVVNLGPQVSGNGLLVSVVFQIVKANGVSPLVLAAGTGDPSTFSVPPGQLCPLCPSGAPNWTRLIGGTGNDVGIDVQTSDGYFKNTQGTSGPIASFQYSPSNPSQGQTVTFDASGSFDPDNFQGQYHGIVEYLWDFGDRSATPNATTFSPFVTHNFVSTVYPNKAFAGNFSIRLTVIDTDSGFQGMMTLRLEITPGVLHDVGITQFIVSQSNLSQGQNVTATVDVSNLGSVSETFDLTLTYGIQNLTLGGFTGQTIAPGRIDTSQFTFSTVNFAPGFYSITATVSDPLDTNPANNVAVGYFEVLMPDEPPTASFTFTPTIPVVGQDVLFNGNSSMDPDGTVQFWSWSFGDGYYQQYFGYPFADHIYNYPGNYTVILTVTDSSGLMASKTLTIRVAPRPQHDVGLVFVASYPPVAVSGQQISLEAGIVNTGSNSSTVDLTFYYNGKVAVTQRGLLIPMTSFTYYVYVQWDTTGVAAGNYTLSATIFLSGDSTPADNSLSDGQVMILPPPVLTLVPSSGPVGTLVLVHGSGFITSGQFYPVELEMTFDNQLVGLFFIQSSSFNFSFDVPDAQVGAHTVHALQLFPSNLDVQAVFTVTPAPAPVSVSVSVGTIYFPGDTATIFVLTTLNGQASPVGTLQVVLIRPSGANLTLSTVRVATGLYRASYIIPSTGPIGTYAVIVRAHLAGSGDGSALSSFEVKPSWLSSNSKNIATGVAITGLVGVAALAWRKGYFRKNDEEESP